MPFFERAAAPATPAAATARTKKSIQIILPSPVFELPVLEALLTVVVVPVEVLLVVVVLELLLEPLVELLLELPLELLPEIDA